MSGAWDKTLKIWDAQTGTCRLTLQQLPEGHWAGVGVAQNGRPSLVVSPEAWRWLMWRIEKPGTDSMEMGPFETGPFELVPLETFGPVEGLE